jgi:hypothetical protein
MRFRAITILTAPDNPCHSGHCAGISWDEKLKQLLHLKKDSLFCHKIVGRKMRYLFFWVVVGFVIIPGCQDSTSSIDKSLPDVQLAVVDVGCTDALLHIQFAKSVTGKALELYRDGEKLRTMTVSGSDTLIWDDSLAQNTNYQWRAQWRDNSGKRSEISTTTLDTTSSEFSWEVWEWGDHSTSAFFDVAIINSNSIWAVGLIYIDGEDDKYNAAFWNGETWKLMRIPSNMCGGVLYTDIVAVFAFDENDIWFAHNDVTVSHFDGHTFTNDCRTLPLINGGFIELWGTSSQDMYAVGRNGTIVHYNGDIWTKIESNTEADISDIWGVTDDSGNKYLYVTAGNKFNASEKKLLRIHADNSITEENWFSETKNPYSIWFINENRVFVCGGGVHRRDAKTKWSTFIELPAIFTNRIRGSASNDIFVVGDFGLATHYNGQNWRIYNSLYQVTAFYSLDVRDNRVVMVGLNGIKAIIYKGER